MTSVHYWPVPQTTLSLNTLTKSLARGADRNFVKFKSQIPPTHDQGQCLKYMPDFWVRSLPFRQETTSLQIQIILVWEQLARKMQFQKLTSPAYTLESLASLARSSRCPWYIFLRKQAGPSISWVGQSYLARSNYFWINSQQVGPSAHISKSPLPQSQPLA